MAYIIEDARILKESNLERTSLLINHNRIQLLRPSFSKYHYIRMNASPFIMTSPHTIFDPEIPFRNDSFQKMKQYFIDSFLKKGCTVFVTYASLENEYLFYSSLNQLKRLLLGSPIDFIIGLKIPLKILSPSLIRICKKERIPVIFVEIEKVEDLYNIPWGWVREAMFPYNCPLAPIFKQENAKIRRKMAVKWAELMKIEKLPFIETEIKAKSIISPINLRKMGVYPIKSCIYQGGEASYNFYTVEEGVDFIEESELIHYHSHRLLITVHKGTVVRAGGDILFRPGFGEQVIIQTPSFYSES